MKTLAISIACALLAAAGSFWIAWSLRDDVRPAQVGESSREAPGGGGERGPGDSGEAAAGWGRVERAIDRLADRIAALEQRVDSPHSAASARTEASPPVAIVDPQSLRQALDEVDEQREREKYEGLSAEQMLAESRRLQYEVKDPAAAERVLRRLLARDLDPTQRALALTEMGIMQRNRGDQAASEQTLGNIVRERGMTDQIGASAAYQLIWTTWSRDRREALGIADALARDASDEFTRLYARWSGAMLAAELGDTVRARADYQAIINQCGDRGVYQGLAKDVRGRLDGLNGK